MTPLLIAQLALESAQTIAPEPPARHVVDSTALALELSGCAQIDQGRVEQLLAAEFATGETKTTSDRLLHVFVTCHNQTGAIRVTDPEGGSTISRVVNLSVFSERSLDAKTRELTLLIGELVRAVLSVASEEPPPEKSSDQPEPPHQAPVPAPAPSAPGVSPEADSRTELLLGASAEAYSSGYWQSGPSLAGRLSPWSWFGIEARLGARWTQRWSSESGDVGLQALVGSLGVTTSLSRQAAVHWSWLARAEAQYITIEGSSDELSNEAVRRATAWLFSTGPTTTWALSSSSNLHLETALQVPIESLTILDGVERVTAIRGVGLSVGVGLAVDL